MLDYCLTCPVHNRWSVSRRKFLFLQLMPKRSKTNTELNMINVMMGILSALDRSSRGSPSGVVGTPMAGARMQKNEARKDEESNGEGWAGCTPRTELLQISHVVMLCRFLYIVRDGWTCCYICSVNILRMASQIQRSGRPMSNSANPAKRNETCRRRLKLTHTTVRCARARI